MWLKKFLRSRAVSPLSYVLMRRSYNFGELVSCFRVHVPPILIECLLSNGVDLLLVSTTVVGFGGINLFFWAGEDFEMLFLSVIIAVKTWRFSVSIVIFSSVSLWFSVSSVSFSLVFFWFLSASYLLVSMMALMTRNCSSELVSILLPHFGILKLVVWRLVIYGADGR